jgi:hypothetical protein
MTNPFLDKNGEQVVHFAADVRTLGKLGELSGKIIEMAESGAWRKYRTAVGTDSWREGEFDYFLIACDLAYADVYRAIAHDKAGETVRAMMEPDADPAKRRTLEQAAAKWHAPVPETLVDRAARLGWAKADGDLRVPPLSDRQRHRRTATRWSFKIERKADTVDERARAIVDKLAEDDELRKRVYQLLHAESGRQRYASGSAKPKTRKHVATPTS